MDRYQKLLEAKAKCKRELIGKMFFPRKPVVLIDFSRVENPGQYEDLLKGLDDIALTTLIIPPLENIEIPESRNMHIVTPEQSKKAFEAADFAVVLDNDLPAVWQHGCVPIAKLDGDSTSDYNPLQEKGNGFYFKNPTKWEVFAAIVRALETYQFPYDWENLIREILNYRSVSDTPPPPRTLLEIS